MDVYLVRHPRPLLASGICYGQSDVAVSDAACRAVQLALQLQLPANLPVLSSPLRRCAALAAHLHPAPVFDARLMEMDFGRWEMQPWDNIARHEIDAWAADPAAYRPGGGESVTMMAQRLLGFAAALPGHGWPAALIVCHAGSMRLLQHWRPGITAEELARLACQHENNFQFGQCLKLKLINL